VPRTNQVTVQVTVRAETRDATRVIRRHLPRGGSTASSTPCTSAHHDGDQCRVCVAGSDEVSVGISSGARDATNTARVRGAWDCVSLQSRGNSWCHGWVTVAYTWGKCSVRRFHTHSRVGRQPIPDTACEKRSRGSRVGFKWSPPSALTAVSRSNNLVVLSAKNPSAALGLLRW
jgi:hypothetical protein